MKLLTWNINGIRASKIPLPQLLDSLQADIICLQETKVTRDMLDEMTAVVEGYSAYFSFSRKKSGYSGVVTYCKEPCLPVKAEEGLAGTLTKKETNDLVGCYGNLCEFSKEELKCLDAEGRAVITQHEIRMSDGSCSFLAVINVYCPRYGPDNEDRHKFKLRFFALLQTRAEALIQEGSHVVIMGDINTTHKNLDHCEPESQGGSHSLPSRIWLNQMMWPKQREIDLQNNSNLLTEVCALPANAKGGRFVDTFRYCHPNKKDAYTNWCTLTGARQTNYGRRLDYILCDVDLAKATLTDCSIMADIEGSDHCPVKASFSCGVVTALKCPSHCAKFMPEFAGKQQKLSTFFTKSYDKPPEIVNEKNNVKHSMDSMSSPNVTQKKSISKNCHQQKNSSPHSLKRQSSESLVSYNKKKKKLSSEDNRSKQTSLMGFIGKKLSLSPVSGSRPGGNAITTTKCGTGNNLAQTEKSKRDATVESLSDSGSSEISSSQEAASVSSSIPQDVDISQKLETPKEIFEVDKITTVTTSKTKSPVQKPTEPVSDTQQALAWKTLLKGPPPAPMCTSHKEVCVLRTVKKTGPNQGKQFYTCARPDGASGNPEARCNFFKWVKDLKR